MNKLFSDDIEDTCTTKTNMLYLKDKQDNAGSNLHQKVALLLSLKGLYYDPHHKCFHLKNNSVQ